MIDLEYSTFEIPPKKKKIFKAIFWDGNHVYILKSKSLVIFCDDHDRSTRYFHY